MEEIVKIIRALKDIEDKVIGICRTTEGRSQGLAAEAQDCIRRAQVYLDQIVRKERRDEERSPRRYGGRGDPRDVGDGG